MNGLRVLPSTVAAYFRDRIFAESSRNTLPENFRVISSPPSFVWSVRACRSANTNMVEVRLYVDAGVISDLRLSCVLCDPGTYVVADLMARWARGRTCSQILSCDVDIASGEVLRALGRVPDWLRDRSTILLLSLKQAIAEQRTAHG
jgi:hypothetical protein